MDTKSDVYLTITDNSVTTSGSQSFIPIIPMLTQKGEIGLNLVTGSDFKSIVGYDVSYNSNYYGLEQILSEVSYGYVWRLNQNAYLDNLYFTSASGTKTTLSQCTTAAQLKAVENLYLGVGHNYVGNWGTYAVKFSPTMEVSTITSAIVTGGQIITINNVSTSEADVSMLDENDATVATFGGIRIYDADNTSLTGVLVLNGTTYNVFSVSDGVVGTTAVGTAAITDNTAVITLTTALSTDPYWNFRYVNNNYKEWTLTYATYDSVNDVYSTDSTYDFSTDSTSDIYYTDVDFGDLFVSIAGSISGTMTSIRSYMLLEGGSNGLASLVTSNVDTSVLNTVSANAILMNGFMQKAVINKIITKAAAKKIHSFVDTPAYTKYTDAYSWRESIYSSEYVVVASKPDVVDNGDDTSIYVYPSVMYATIFANMLADQGSLNYPPAGRSYGVVSVTSLLTTDFSLFGDELKTNRINYPITESGTSCMWEQRTTYSLNSDLSYIAPVFILDSLSDELIDFEKNYNFRYMSSTDLLNQESGLNDILSTYESKGFIYDYTLTVPTYAEAQEAGRTLTITIEIQISKDSEVININVVLD